MTPDANLDLSSPSPRFRVRAFGCLGFLRINGGPTATPTAEVVNVQCSRIQREDREVTEDVTAPV